ncbi:DNA-primase RepB domain-containing protein [Fibrella forsythiae]|uniref:RepB-like DNA primase domain-containing protein n=1 Tax=Fibrella forsythiae TaxID=2817061 RepID=A0ABS3JNJ7_9BACT|nr:DNA-primase RepB domain-containing protein [Fibrella forsythiae]MBO0951580.1 hypothetical protein [Fibrella forsythiae]
MSSLNLTQHAIEQYVEALQAAQYRVRLVNFQADQAKPVTYTGTQLTDPKTVAFLRWQNSLGFDVYARPVGWQYVLLDDLTRDALTLIKADELRPCLLLETSPANYQAWVILAHPPTDRAHAKATCRDMAQRYGADLCSAEPDHVGRLPGLTNRKAKYQLANGRYPFVRLLRATSRLSSFSTPVGGCVPTASIPLSQDMMASGFSDGLSVPDRSVPDRSGTVAHSLSRTAQTFGRQGGTGQASHSEHDFGIVVGLVQKGWDDSRIRAHLLTHSPDLMARKGNYTDKYILRTIQAARRRGG